MDAVDNEIIVFRPIVCFCERECCSKDDRRRRFKHRLEASVGADVESCCDESSPLCKQDCCTNEAENAKSGFFNKLLVTPAPLLESERKQSSSAEKNTVTVSKERLLSKGNKSYRYVDSSDGGDEDSCCNKNKKVKPGKHHAHGKGEEHSHSTHGEGDSSSLTEEQDSHKQKKGHHAHKKNKKEHHSHSEDDEEDSCCKPKNEHDSHTEEDSCCKPKKKEHHSHSEGDEEDSCCKPKKEKGHHSHSEGGEEEDSCCNIDSEHDSHGEEDSCCKPKKKHDSHSEDEDSCCKPKKKEKEHASHDEEDSCCQPKDKKLLDVQPESSSLEETKKKGCFFSVKKQKKKGDKKGASQQNDVIIEMDKIQESEKSKMLMSVTGITCASCAKTVEDHLKKLSGILSVNISVTTAKVEVVYYNKTLTDQTILDHVNTLSFKAELIAAALATNIEVILEHKDQHGEIEAYLKELDGVKNVNSSQMIKRKVTQDGKKRTELVVSFLVDYDPDLTGARTVIDSLRNTFSTITVAQKRIEDNFQKGMKTEVRRWFNRLMAVIALAIPVVIFEFVLPSIEASKQAIDTKVYNGLSVKNLVEFVLTTPIQFFFALPFYKVLDQGMIYTLIYLSFVTGRISQADQVIFTQSAYESLKYVRRANMDLLICLSTTAAYVYSIVISIVLLVNPSLVSGETFFATSAILLLLIILGRFIEVYVNSRTSNILSQIMLLQAENAVLVGKYPRIAPVCEDGTCDDGTKKENKTLKKNKNAPKGKQLKRQTYDPLEEQVISVYLIERGDVLKVLPGEKIPTDGLIVDGKSNINESMLTGESRPVFKKEGDSVFGGTINKDGALLIKSVKIPGENTLDVITNLIEKTQMSKARIERQADKISSYFVPCIVAMAAIVFVIWITLASVGIVTSDIAPFPLAMGFTISVLVVSCPCALALSAPNAIIIGTGVAAKLGILFKGGEAIEACRSLDTICFDKTGTLTTGILSVTDVKVLDTDNFTEEQMMSYAASIEQSSEHPLSQAIVQKAKELKYEIEEPKNTKTVPGMGIYGSVAGRTVHVGNSKLMKKAGVDAAMTEKSSKVQQYRSAGKTVVFVAIDGQLIGLIAIYDSPKPEAKEVVEYLYKKSIQVWMISGDHESTAISVAEQLGIAPEFVVAGVLPKDKLKKIEELQTSGRTVAMVGDGINDGPALAQANIGIAVGSASNLAQEASDIVLMTSNLTQLLVALNLAIKVNKRIRLNLGWSFLWNALIIPIAAGVFWPLNFTLPAAFAGLSEIFSIFPVIVLSVLLKTYRIPKSIKVLTRE